jgi:hypothetical protein
MNLFWRTSDEPDFSGLRDRLTTGGTPEGTAAMRELADRLDRLSLLCAGMWQLFQVHGNFNEQDLIERVKAIDLLDGRPDGQLRLPVATCVACQRPNSRRHLRCIYCGTELRLDSAFDAVH